MLAAWYAFAAPVAQSGRAGGHAVSVFLDKPLVAKNANK
jgi:hypothetical protein